MMPSSIIYIFLSHLCGGKVDDVLHLKRPYFLSHLCGGKVEGVVTATALLFLSHLCGGKAYFWL